MPCPHPDCIAGRQRVAAKKPISANMDCSYACRSSFCVNGQVRTRRITAATIHPNAARSCPLRVKANQCGLHDEDIAQGHFRSTWLSAFCTHAKAHSDEALRAAPYAPAARSLARPRTDSGAIADASTTARMGSPDGYPTRPNTAQPRTARRVVQPRRSSATRRWPCNQLSVKATRAYDEELADPPRRRPSRWTYRRDAARVKPASGDADAGRVAIAAPAWGIMTCRTPAITPSHIARVGVRASRKRHPRRRDRDEHA